MFALTVPYFFAVITEMSPIAARTCRLKGDYAATTQTICISPVPFHGIWSFRSWIFLVPPGHDTAFSP
jgi:hypothetical protein